MDPLSHLIRSKSPLRIFSIHSRLVLVLVPFLVSTRELLVGFLSLPIVPYTLFLHFLSPLVLHIRFLASSSQILFFLLFSPDSLFVPFLHHTRFSPPLYCLRSISLYILPRFEEHSHSLEDSLVLLDFLFFFHFLPSFSFFFIVLFFLGVYSNFVLSFHLLRFVALVLGVLVAYSSLVPFPISNADSLHQTQSVVYRMNILDFPFSILPSNAHVLLPNSLLLPMVFFHTPDRLLLP